MENWKKISFNVPRVLVSALKSTGGKTIFSSALMKIAKDKGEAVASFKCGSDFIDPLYHSVFLGNSPSLKMLSENKSTNLDPFICCENDLKALLYENTKGKTLAIAEGVMGLYSGVGGETGIKSTNEVSLLTKTPVILLVSLEDFEGKTFEEALSYLKAFLSFKENLVGGIVFNKIEKPLYDKIKSKTEKALGIPVFGFVPFLENLTFENRRLGLEPFWEEKNAKEKSEKISEIISKTIDFDGILSLSKKAKDLSFNKNQKPKENPKIKIAVTLDSAFCFHNKDNIDFLKSLGARIVYVSPIFDEKLPDVDGIYLTGGFLLENLSKLSENKSFQNSLKAALEKGLPSFSEGAGYVYLCESIESKAQKTKKLVGFFDTKISTGERLNSFGYHVATATKDSKFFKKGEKYNLRNFNYFYPKYSFPKENLLLNLKKFGKEASYKDGEERENSFGALCYFSFRNNEKIAERFFENCLNFKLWKGKTK